MLQSVMLQHSKKIQLQCLVLKKLLQPELCRPGRPGTGTSSLRCYCTTLEAKSWTGTANRAKDQAAQAMEDSVGK
jgi:hypothetical protein